MDLPSRIKLVLVMWVLLTLLILAGWVLCKIGAYLFTRFCNWLQRLSGRRALEKHRRDREQWREKWQHLVMRDENSDGNTADGTNKKPPPSDTGC